MSRIAIACIAVMFLFAVGCSSSSTMTTPDNPSGFDAPDVSSLPVWVSDYDENNNPVGGQGMLGLFSVHIDPISLAGELTPLRTGALEDVLEAVDISNFMQMSPCFDCVKMRGIKLNADSNLEVKIGIRHPFSAGDPLKPITGKNRADLHVFNVEGIVVSDGIGVDSFADLGVVSGGFNLLNADGYTGYLDSSLDEIFPTDANIHPFITYFADYLHGNFYPTYEMGFESVTYPPPSGNLVMAMGCLEDVRSYIFDLTDGDIDFIFAVGCTYAVSTATMSMRFSPEYRIPQHNKKAASHVKVIIESNNLADSDTTSEAELTIEVLDISHDVAVGTDLDEMRADSSITGIEVEIPGITLTPTSFDITPTGGNERDPENPLTYTGTILNEAGAVGGTYPGIVKVTDSYPSGLNQSPLLNGMDGIKRVAPIESSLNGLFDITEFATYQRFVLSITILNQYPVAILAPDPASRCGGCTIWFDGSASYDPDGVIETYEFDFDYDGMVFGADISGTESIVESPPFDEGNYVVALRVIDNEGGSNIDTVDATISAANTLDVSPYSKVNVTDTSFSDIVFTPNGFTPIEWHNRQLGLEAMVTASEYIYAVFYANGNDGEGVYIARSDDNGDSWGLYNFVHELTPLAVFSGAALAVSGSEVFVVSSETDSNAVFLSHNDNNGEGDFTEYQISDSLGFCSTTIAVDPLDSNNIYIGVGERFFPTHQYFYDLYIFTSNDGPDGTFNEQIVTSWYRPAPYSNYSQAYTGEIKIAQDGDVYVVVVANATLAVYKSVDFGVSFTEVYGGWAASWDRDADYCFAMNDPETIHLVITNREWNPLGEDWFKHVYRRSEDGGVTWSTVVGNLHDSDKAFTNAAVCTDCAGNVYIVYTDISSGYGEVYGRFSDSGGDSFGTPIQISDDPNSDGHVEITLTTSGCDVVIGWLEDRDGTPRVVSRRG